MIRNKIKNNMSAVNPLSIVSVKRICDKMSEEQRKELVKYICDTTPNCHKKDWSSSVFLQYNEWKYYASECDICTNCNEEIWDRQYSSYKCSFCHTIICHDCRFHVIGHLLYNGDRHIICNTTHCTKRRKKIYDKSICALQQNVKKGTFIGKCSDCHRGLYNGTGCIRYGEIGSHSVRCLECVLCIVS